MNETTARFKNNFKITEYFSKQLSYSGNLILDGKYIPVKEEVKIHSSSGIINGKIPRSKKRRKVSRGKVLIWGADYATHDLPHYEFGDSENGWTFDNYFRQLKEIGYPLVSLTVDDKEEMARAAKRHYRDCIIQHCIRHYFTKVSRILAVGNIKKKIRSGEDQIERLFYAANDDYLPVTRRWSIKQAVKLSNEIAELEFKYELPIEFQNIIESILYSDDHETAARRAESLEKCFWPNRYKLRSQFDKQQIAAVKKLMADFKEHKEYLLNYLKYPHANIPNTTNLIEGYNSQLELRLNSIKGFETVETARNYLNVWIIKRRFSKFTDCKKHFRGLNGKTPLECGGADISDIRDWVEFCQN